MHSQRVHTPVLLQRPAEMLLQSKRTAELDLIKEFVCLFGGEVLYCREREMSHHPVVVQAEDVHISGID